MQAFCGLLGRRQGESSGGVGVGDELRKKSTVVPRRQLGGWQDWGSLMHVNCLCKFLLRG